VDVKGNPLKFSRDPDSDWTVKNGIPYYGLKEHVAVDANSGFVLTTELTPASVHDSAWLLWCVAANGIDALFRQRAFNIFIFRGGKILGRI
jgi:hypothetical protein